MAGWWRRTCWGPGVRELEPGGLVGEGLGRSGWWRRVVVKIDLGAEWQKLTSVDVWWHCEMWAYLFYFRYNAIKMPAVCPIVLVAAKESEASVAGTVKPPLHQEGKWEVWKMPGGEMIKKKLTRTRHTAHIVCRKFEFCEEIIIPIQYKRHQIPKCSLQKNWWRANYCISNIALSIHNKNGLWFWNTPSELS